MFEGHIIRKIGEVIINGNELGNGDGIRSLIYTIRGVQAILDKDLAKLYGVETRVLNQAVKRNKERFPERFCFQVTDLELKILTSQFVISSWGGRRTNPYAFNEQGITMLSAVLKSDDTTVYHFGASLKDLGKKWFAFSKMEMGAVEMLVKLQ